MISELHRTEPPHAGRPTAMAADTARTAHGVIQRGLRTRARLPDRFRGVEPIGSYGAASLADSAGAPKVSCMKAEAVRFACRQPVTAKRKSMTPQRATSPEIQSRVARRNG